MHVGDVAVHERVPHFAPRTRLADQVRVERVAEPQAMCLIGSIGHIVVDAGDARVYDFAGG